VKQTSPRECGLKKKKRKKEIREDPRKSAACFEVEG